MKPGDLVRTISWKEMDNQEVKVEEYGMLIGFKKSGGYEYAEVMWFNHRLYNKTVSSIQKNLIEVVK